MTMNVEAFDASGAAARARDEDRAAIVDLQARRGAELYGLARRLGLDADEADDAVQEALMRAWLALDADDPVRQLDAWIFRIIKG